MIVWNALSDKMGKDLAPHISDPTLHMFELGDCSTVYQDGTGTCNMSNKCYLQIFQKTF